MLYRSTLSSLRLLIDLDQWFSKCGTRIPLVVREIRLVVRRGISELNINQTACPPKQFFFNCFKWERLFHAEDSAVLV